MINLWGPERDTPAVPSSDPVHPGDTVTLCPAVISDFDNKTCPQEPTEPCLITGSHKSQPIFFYTERNGVDECGNKTEGLPARKYVHSFFMNISSSDVWTYYCAVTSYRLLVNTSNLDTEGNYFHKHICMDLVFGATRSQTR